MPDKIGGIQESTTPIDPSQQRNRWSMITHSHHGAGAGRRPHRRPPHTTRTERSGPARYKELSFECTTTRPMKQRQQESEWLILLPVLVYPSWRNVRTSVDTRDQTTQGSSCLILFALLQIFKTPHKKLLNTHTIKNKHGNEHEILRW